ncbi:hypothetical protein CAEBREN_20172 [Caenorhabditis brenneri]|uniref:Uncharacterized protein n=1 Tax=Caenorhabditis brenneri TaxID=135651 RepID=G0MDZ7_CAEBE|nr:hypothetical protein CAEBREN_20172 [Caenorhabditis brenneri]
MSATNLTDGHSDLEEVILEQKPYLSVVRDLKILLLNDNPMEIHPNASGYVKAEPAVTEFAIHNSNLSTISENLLDYDKLESFKLGGKFMGLQLRHQVFAGRKV